MTKVDLIIPAYNAHGTIDRVIGSIIMQTVRDDIRITIADDASPDGDYTEVVQRYSPVISIQSLRLPENGGPGVARQYAIDRTDGEYMVFMDADDTLSNAFAVETMLLAIDNEPDAIAVFGSFTEETDNDFIEHDEDSVWMHGKIYRRSFWEDNQIRFHPTSRANEDNGVNTIIKLTAADVGKKILTIPYTTYYWHCQPNSITRNNNSSYYFTSSYSGYVDNMIYAVQNAVRITGEYTEKIMNYCATVMCFLYCYWNETVLYRNDYAYINRNACKRFYDEVYSKIASQVKYDTFARIYNKQMQISQDRFPECMPTQTIFDFLADIKEDDIKNGNQ